MRLTSTDGDRPHFEIFGTPLQICNVNGKAKGTILMLLGIHNIYRINISETTTIILCPSVSSYMVLLSFEHTNIIYKYQQIEFCNCNDNSYH